MTNKKKYERFCRGAYIPIFSQPWWMDAVCGESNWDVWLYEKGKDILAAMPYYMEIRGEYKYITKALLTQNNGLIISYPVGQKLSSRYSYQEKIITAACAHINSLDLDVYEQQFHHSFDNWLPFFWDNFTAITRYTCVLEHPIDPATTLENISSNYRNKIRSAEKQVRVCTDIDAQSFYYEHEKIYKRQGIPCPFSLAFWTQLYNACVKHNAGQLFCSRDHLDNITSVLFLVWDEKSAYQILGGAIPDYQSTHSYTNLIYNAILFASRKELAYDFEGSVIKRIFTAFKEFGPTIQPYFRIRKVFNRDIIMQEAEQYARNICSRENIETINTIY